jgi:chemotaxis family two-component system response regulator Rcp1
MNQAAKINDTRRQKMNTIVNEVQSAQGVKAVDILLVEDSRGDARLAMEALRDSKIRNTLHLVTDGVEAMDFLRCQGKYSGADRPDLILLDLNLPKKDGREVLAEIKSDESLRRIPVVILTVSKAEEDIIKSYNLHANCYITKPIDMEQFMKVVKSIEDFWFTIVKLPPNGDKNER